MQPDDMRMAQPPPTESVRLIFEFEGSEIRLVSRQPVDVVPPVGEPVAGFEAEMGFWAELRDAEEGVLFRGLVPDPMAQFPEVFSEEPDQTISRAATPLEKGAFTVVVPSVPEADHLSFVRTAPPPGAEALGLEAVSTGEIARFSLKESPGPGQRRES